MASRFIDVGASSPSSSFSSRVPNYNQLSYFFSSGSSKSPRYLHRHPSNASSFSLSRSRIDCSLKAAIEGTNGACHSKGEIEHSILTALSPLDGRYWGKVKELAPFMNEYGLIYYRVFVEIKWLLKLSQIPEVPEVPNFSGDAQSYLQGIIDGFSVDDAAEIKKIEKITNHDVKVVLEFFHFACTSEDINNLAHALMLKDAINNVMFPVMDELVEAICDMSKDNASVPMLSRTHGQTASPTTLGKEMAIFAIRLSIQRRRISQVEIMGKFQLGTNSEHCRILFSHRLEILDP